MRASMGAIVQAIALLVLSVLGLSRSLVSAGPPIPLNGGDGFTWGPDNAEVKVAGFFDLMCPNCKSAWPAIKGMLEHFEGSNKVQFNLHLFPLPYHRNAFLVAQAAHAIGERNTTEVFQWMEAVYKHQDALGNTATDHLTTSQVRKSISDIAPSAGLSATFVAQVLESPLADSNARTSWKYACYRGIFGTPMLLVNDVPAPDSAAGWSKEEWISFVNNLASNSLTLPLEIQQLS